MGDAYFKGYAYCFCQMFQGLHLFQGLCLFQSLEYYVSNLNTRLEKKMQKIKGQKSASKESLKIVLARGPRLFKVLFYFIFDVLMRSLQVENQSEGAFLFFQNGLYSSN